MVKIFNAPDPSTMDFLVTSRRWYLDSNADFTGMEDKIIWADAKEMPSVSDETCVGVYPYRPENFRVLLRLSGLDTVSEGFWDDLNFFYTKGSHRLLETDKDRWLLVVAFYFYYFSGNSAFLDPSQEQLSDISTVVDQIVSRQPPFLLRAEMKYLEYGRKCREGLIFENETVKVFVSNEPGSLDYFKSTRIGKTVPFILLYQYNRNEVILVAEDMDYSVEPLLQRIFGDVTGWDSRNVAIAQAPSLPAFTHNLPEILKTIFWWLPN
jgi:hypothetical protein